METRLVLDRLSWLGDWVVLGLKLLDSFLWKCKKQKQGMVSMSVAMVEAAKPLWPKFKTWHSPLALTGH